MKKSILILLLLAFALVGKAQQVPAVIIDTAVIDSPQVKPEFVGGIQNFYKYLSHTLRYPAVAREDNIQGKVILKMVIEKDGTITHITVIQSAGVALDHEAIRVMTIAPKFAPGQVNGVPVRSWYTMPLSFSLSSK